MALDGGRRGQPRAARRGLVAVLLSVLVLSIACSPQPVTPHTASTSAPSGPSQRPPLPAGAFDFGPQIEAAIADDSSRRLENIESVLVSVTGRPTAEHYRHATTATTHTHVWSVTKSIVATLAGIAVAEGKIDNVDQTVAELLPERRRQMSAELSRVTLRQLLTMSSGLTDQIYVDQTSATDDSLPAILGLEPDTSGVFNYSNVGAHLVAVIVAERVGMSLLSYARSRLFGPLGIATASAYAGREAALQPSGNFQKAEFAWATTSDGFQHGCCMLKLTGRDMIALGRLQLSNGRWQGERLLPADWVSRATAPSETNPDYGWMWWRQSVGNRQSFAATGAFGQLILVVPDLSAVITVSSRQAGNSSVDSGDLMALIEKVILPEID